MLQRLSQWRVAGLAALVAVSYCCPARADNDAGGAWLIVSTGDHFRYGEENSRWRYAFDAQYRWFDRLGGVSQTLLRPALGFDLTPSLSAWVGYAWVHTDRDPGVHIGEHRLWQQLAWQKAGFLNSAWLLRARLEQRQRQSADDTGLSLRLMVRAATRVGKGDTRLFAGFESFYNLTDTDWGLETGFAQLRSSIGLQFDLHPGLGLEASYMNQYSPRSRLRDDMNHLLVLNFRLRF